MLSTIATSVKDLSLSADGQEATFILVTKHSGDIAVTLPSVCLRQLALPLAPPRPAIAPAHQPATIESTGAVQPPGNVSVRVISKWVIGADKPRGLVIAILDHQMPSQYAFALDSKAAAAFASAMSQKAPEVPQANVGPSQP